jgi:hypothetical protein
MKLFVGVFLHFRRFRKSWKIVVRTLFRLIVPPSPWHPTSEYFDGNGSGNGIVWNECIFHVSMSAFSSHASTNIPVLWQLRSKIEQYQKATIEFISIFIFIFIFIFMPNRFLRFSMEMIWKNDCCGSDFVIIFESLCKKEFQRK